MLAASSRPPGVTRWIVDAVHAGDATVRVDPFAAIEIPLAELWVPP